MSTQPLAWGLLPIAAPAGPLQGAAPARTRERSALAAKVLKRPARRVPPKKLLIADDQEGVRQLVRMILQGDDYEVLEARDGEEALRLARRHLPGVVLLDVMMPRLSGFDVCRTLKGNRDTAGIVVLMLTVKAQGDDFAEGEEAGADGYFVKPFSPLALIKRVEEIFSEKLG